MLESLFDKVACLSLQLHFKKTPAQQVLSCEICEIFNNIYFEGHMQSLAKFIETTTHLVESPSLDEQKSDIEFFQLNDKIITTSSRSQMFFKKSVLKNFANFTGKHMC